MINAELNLSIVWLGSTGVLKMGIPTIFQEWPDLERLEAKVEVNNMASQRVLEKA